MITVNNLSKSFPVKDSFFKTFISLRSRRHRAIRAVNRISFSINRQEIFGLAGESGCGKTTTAMLLLGLYKPTEGTVSYDGKEIASLSKAEMIKFRRNAQLIFQDPYESLNPRFSVIRAIEEPLIVNNIGNRTERKEIVIEAMKKAKLMPVEAFLDKFPHELSGGERQRVCIARAIVLKPTLLVADEAVSMLDVSIRAGILNLLKSLTNELKMATLYISHDLSLLGSICDKIGIMYAGEIVELGSPEAIVTRPRHPYTQALIEAVPIPEFYKRGEDHYISLIRGEPPDLINYPEACCFRPRCKYSKRVCQMDKPRLEEIGKGHSVACHLVRG
ncbi:MAG: ABC transporter ATP-binding protein [Deltaproteobacteria bacterium]|nr:ABC transporter ATP-binding protein [Deltaproteobacteria bacterium]